MDKTRILIVCFAVLGFGGACDGLLCNCTTSQCEKNGYRCETTGACMASTSLIDGQEQHIKICIDKEKLVPPGQPFFCLSAEGLLNIHCCYTDYCNSLDLKVHSVTVQPDLAEQMDGWGPVELAAVVAGSVFALCVLVLLGLFLFQRHWRANAHRQRLEAEDSNFL
ncbi:activin receptor type-1B-like [Neoarius graeffei]|uniref:activin receptor type-1B-like n=1 Tax=Neoarius graeffei TaxID=443677 RepID=UPI00298C2B97|nr:activin receptor type-1B-like [Neoarius graeffei]